MNTRTDSKQPAHSEERLALIAQLDRLEPVCKDMLANMPETAKDSSAKDIQSVRRDLLKAHNKANELRADYEGRLGLEFVSDEEAEKIREVAEARKIATDDYFRVYQLETGLSRTSREFASVIKGAALNKLSSLMSEIKEVRQGLFDLYWALPDLGMTFAEWDSLSTLARRGMRKTGRPPLPLECQIELADMAVASLLEDVKRMSGGELNTLEVALQGVALSASGRPAISPIGKDERLIGKLKRELEALDPDAFPSKEEVAKQPRLGDTYEMRSNRILGKIADVQARVNAAEAELVGAEKHRRELEKLRARHRDLVLMEVDTQGEEQAKFLLDILLNEQAQQEVFSKIYEFDPNATEVLTHKVNPRATKNRINQLRMNGRLKESEMKILETIERNIVGSRTIRSR